MSEAAAILNLLGHSEKPPVAHNRMRRLAIVIGIDAYPPPQTRLRGCVGDARRFGRFLYSARGGSFEQVLPLMDRAANLAQLRRVFRQASESAWDQVVVYFSGHGSHQGILTWDGLMGFVELARSIRSIPARWHLLVLDACEAGAVHQHFDGVGGLPAPEDSAGIYLDLLRRAHPGLRVITAVDRQTNATERGAQGVFTTALLRAARDAWPDLGSRGVSAGRVFLNAAGILDREGDPLPQRSGGLDDFPLALTEVLQPLGGAGVHQRPWHLWGPPGGPLSARVDFAVRVIGRKLLPTFVHHVFHDGTGWSCASPSHRVIPQRNDEQLALFVSVPVGQLPTGRSVESLITVMDERDQIVGQHRVVQQPIQIPMIQPVRVVRSW
ncbi:caspase family protein [Pyxidicoccus fallax]|uniref:Caspase family protein n=1 Tax=Pyxidicoccus fallax TaxID=394095 RepID=A0A848LW54_9BACT|nr:caspase family protein [Pyxidicoccus fallax]NMO22036.1 caspase family protein [Pyxidicoccus fallax]NPC83533.1 caspase family protein [Pyxidicoccus fallax]